MTPAPIMGTRKTKLLNAARATLKAARAIRISQCKVCCGHYGKICTKDRDHTLSCLKLVISLDTLTSMMKNPTSGARLTKILGLTRTLITRCKSGHAAYCKAVCGEGGRIKKVDRECGARCLNLGAYLIDIDRAFRGF